MKFSQCFLVLLLLFISLIYTVILKKTRIQYKRTNKRSNSKNSSKQLVPEADNPEVLTLQGVSLDGTQSIDYYYPYFIRNQILKFDDDETKDVHLMDKDCKDENCELCIPNHWDKCYKCKLGFLKLVGQCYKYCPDGYQADVVRRKCFPKLGSKSNNIL